MSTRVGSLGLKKYILQFANHHLDFHAAEIKSIISLLGCEAKLNDDKWQKENPFVTLDLPSEQDARNIMGRTVLGKSIYELWASGTTVEDIHNQINTLPSSFVDPFTNQDKSFRIMIETFNKKISREEKLSRIETLTNDGSLFRGKINLTSPDQSFHLLEFYNFDTTSSQRASAEPVQMFFGRWICDGQRDKINEYSLQKRHFIANTSMDVCLSMVMANLGQVKSDDLVLDPFVGSGSLLVSSAYFGAYVMGTDIDYLLLHGKAKPSRAKQKSRSSDESVRSNLYQYGLERQYLDVFVADASRHDLWRQDIRFDAIITDPPYGIREAAVKIVENQEMVSKEEEGEPHYPQKTQYYLGDIFKDLLNFAAKFLRIGGRLVYWLPIKTPEYTDSNVPSHPCFWLEHNCEQRLSTSISRRLITMRKVQDLLTMEMCPPSHAATVEVDHYASSSFRQKYFNKVPTPEERSGHQQVNSDNTDSSRGCVRNDDNDSYQVAGTNHRRESHCLGQVATGSNKTL